MKTRMFYIALLILIALPVGLSAHGTSYEILQGGIGIRAVYADKTPMGDSDVKVYRPGSGKDDIYCSGITDHQGRFFFAPDKQGKWTIAVNDGMGHVIKSSITVDKDIAITATSASGMSFWQKIFAVAALVWGCIGTALYFKGKS